MLDIKNLKIDLEDFYLEDINLNLINGDYLVIIGKSGTGKTVFLETIAGRYNITNGTIIKDYIEISKLPPEKREVGFVYQNYELFGHLNVVENIAFSLKIQGFSKKEITKRTMEIMDDLNITHLKNRYPKELSGGEKQRVAIARSVIKSPSLLLLDEPFSALDYITKENVKEMLKSIHKKYKPIVIHVTHDFKEALYFADKIGIIKDNTIKKVLDNKEVRNIESENELYKYI